MIAKQMQENDVIHAAGGLVWRHSKRGKEIAVVHRPRHDDWSLPKGKLTDKESWSQAALREVEEETNCDVQLEDFAGCSCYVVDGKPKVVLFWNMDVLEDRGFLPNDETDEMLWLTVEKALAKLSYREERALVRSSMVET